MHPGMRTSLTLDTDDLDTGLLTFGRSQEKERKRVRSEDGGGGVVDGASEGLQGYRVETDGEIFQTNHV